MSGHIFISHGSEDRDDATELCAFVESHGVKAWIAPRDVRPGGDYSEALQAAIESCVAFVVLVTEMANKSPYVRAETEMAFSNGKPIFPVRMSDIKPAAGLAFFLKIRHWTDAYGKGRDASMTRLALELQTLAGVAPAPAPPAEAEPIPPAPAPAPAPPPAPVPAPAPASAPPAAPAAPADAELLAAAIGPNANYYIEHWRKVDEKGAKTDWNWAACFANLFWMAYRKMWLPLAAVGAAFILLSVAGTVEPRLSQATFLISIAITFVTGAFGNHLYRKQVRALAADQSLDKDELGKRGGVSVPALWGAIAATIVLILISAAFAMPRIAPGTAAGSGAGAAGGDKPAGNGGQAPAATNGGGTAPAAAMLDHSYLVGRWTDDGNCGEAVEFLADNRFIPSDGGGAGLWDLQGDQLTMSGPGGTQTLRVAALDQNTISVINPDGSTGSSTRC